MEQTCGKHGTEEFLSENLKEQDHLDNICVNGRMMLKQFLNKKDGIAWTRVIWLRTRTHGKCNKHSDSIK
jgi:hypothetical protein